MSNGDNGVGLFPYILDISPIIQISIKLAIIFSSLLAIGLFSTRVHVI